MGLFGGLFGGGSKVTTSNKTTVNTDVDIDLSNIIDLSGLEAVVQQIKDFFVQDSAADAQKSEQLKSLITAQGDANIELTKQQQTLLLLNTAVEAERNQQFAEANKTFKLVALAGGALGAYYILTR